MVRIGIILLLTTLTCYADGVFGPAQSSVFGARRAAVSAAPDVGTPYAWWKMTSADTNFIADWSDSATATNVGATMVYTNGAYASYDGVDDYSKVTGNANFAPTSLTITAWIWLASDTVSGAYGHMIFGGVDVADTSIRYARNTSDHPGGVDVQRRTGLVLGNAAFTYYIAAYSSADVTLSNWVFCAVTWTGGTTTNSVNSYVNGILGNGLRIAGGTWAGIENVASHGIGGSAAPDWPLQGYIDDIRFFPNCLSSNQVFNIYTAGRQ
jgi:hypothetical protein